MRKSIVAALVAGSLAVGGATLLLRPAKSEAAPLPFDLEQSGCCSHHQGVCGCNQLTGKKSCCDGTDSRTCTC